MNINKTDLLKLLTLLLVFGCGKTQNELIQEALVSKLGTQVTVLETSTEQSSVIDSLLIQPIEDSLVIERYLLKYTMEDVKGSIEHASFCMVNNGVDSDSHKEAEAAVTKHEGIMKEILSRIDSLEALISEKRDALTGDAFLKVKAVNALDTTTYYLSQDYTVLEI